MSSLTAYINSIEDKSFDNIKRTFLELGCKVVENDNHYMIFAPNELYSGEYPFYLNHCVGSIFEKETNKMICFGFPKTFDYDEKYSFEFDKIIASEYIDGSLIRAYWDGSFWRLSTNGSLNAYESHWISEKSFGELLDDCLSRIFKETTIFNRSLLIDNLDKSCCYQFLIKHPAVHLEQATKPFIYHVGTFDLTNLCYIEKTVHSLFRKPRVYEFNSIEEMKKSLRGNVKGFIFYAKNKSETQTPRFKLLSEHYTYLRKLLGNTPNLYLRYLECKYEGISNELLFNFPSIKYYSSWVERSLYEIIKNAYGIYVEKYIKRQPTMFVNFFYRPIIKDLHGKFLETKQKITIQTVSSIVHAYHPKRLLFILNGLKYLHTNNVFDPTEQNTSDLEDKTAETVIEKPSKQDYGNKLYPEILKIVGEDKAPKVCGMILEMEEILDSLMINSKELENLCKEALDAINNA